MDREKEREKQSDKTEKEGYDKKMKLENGRTDMQKEGGEQVETCKKIDKQIATKKPHSDTKVR